MTQYAVCTYNTTVLQLLSYILHTTQLKKLSVYTDLRYTYTQVDQLTQYTVHTPFLGHYGQLYTDGDDMRLGSCGM